MLSRLLINNSKLFRKSFQPYITLKFFAAKNKNESSLSDKEVDKTKKTIPQGGLKSDSEKIKPNVAEHKQEHKQEHKPVENKPAEQKQETSKPKQETSSENIKVIETVPNHKVKY